MGQFAVIHVTKGSGNGSALGNHIDRIETFDLNGNSKNNFNNADPDRRNLNKEFVQDKYKNLSLARSVSFRIAEGYNSRTKAGELKLIAKSAVKFVEVNLSGSHERMKELESKPEEFQKWLKANYAFCCEKYGKENIVRFSLHLDETTPHIHCVFVPLTTDGRLSAKEIIGNNTALKKLQDDYAAAMKPFGLERGIEGSLARHTGKHEYISKQNLAIKEVEELIIKKNVLGVDLGIDKDKTIANLKYALIEAKTALKMNNSSQIETNKRGALFKNENFKLTEKIKVKEKEVTQAIKQANENYKKIIFQPEVFQSTKILFENMEKRRREKEEIQIKNKPSEPKKEPENEKRNSKGFRR